MKSKTQQAIEWLTEETQDRRTIAEAARKFGLKNPEGVGLALKWHKIQIAAKKHNHAIYNGGDTIETWKVLRELL